MLYLPLAFLVLKQAKMKVEARKQKVVQRWKIETGKAKLEFEPFLGKRSRQDWMLYLPLSSYFYEAGQGKKWKTRESSAIRDAGKAEHFHEAYRACSLTWWSWMLYLPLVF